MTPTKTYEVTGDLTPDIKGIYVDAGEHNGKRYYKLADQEWFIWWDGNINWNISAVVGEILPVSWFRADPNIEGIFSPGVGATGDATVTEI